jgi:hypothetical protein
MELVIYGAQGIALGAYEALQHLFPERKVSAFVVTKYGNHFRQLAGVPVYELDTFAQKVAKEEKDNIQVLIATPETVMSEIETTLEAYGFFSHVRLTSKRWANLVAYHYVRERTFFPLAALPVGFHRANVQVYQAKHIKDVPIKQTAVQAPWLIPIQVGAAQTDRRVAKVLDSDGETISYKNGNYSELTALYWIWKNQLTNSSEGENIYYGLSHYRRILDFTEDDLLRLVDNEVDVVLPFPMPYEPNIEEHHKRYLSEADWDALLEAIQELHPEAIEEVKSVLAQRYFYNYNILLAKKAVLAEYCEWMFPILERVESLSVPPGNERQDRYLGYMGETLTTLYFRMNQKKLRIVHAGCSFFV